MTVHVCPPPAPDEFPRDGFIGVGFGFAGVLRDGETIIDCSDIDGPEVSGADAERLASADPDHVWEIHLLGPLQERRYRREGREIGRWVLVEVGEGFA